MDNQGGLLMPGPGIVWPKTVIAEYRIVQFYIINRTAVFSIEKITVNGGNGAGCLAKFTDRF